jgi:hypothetical protein
MWARTRSNPSQIIRREETGAAVPISFSIDSAEFDGRNLEQLWIVKTNTKNYNEHNRKRQA